MKKKYKKIYIEIINYCNLTCPFCVKTKREKKMMTKDEFSYVLDQVKPYTDYIYLHIQGEPLMHPDISVLLDIAKSKGFYVNITTNGTLLDKNIDTLIACSAVRQINLSLQALLSLPNKEDYYKNIVRLIKENENIYLSLRLWGNFSQDIIKQELKIFEDELGYEIDLKKSNHLKERVYISLEDEFTWPDLSSPFNSDKGRCEAISQLGILSNGEVVPCCLDKDGIMSMGNIYKTPLKEILESPRYIDMISSFKKGLVKENLCKHCTFLNRFNKKA